MGKNNIQKYDAVIIGSGQAGNPLAKALAAEGWKTAVVERYLIGGSCINYGCTPSKTLIASARTASVSNRSSDYGIHTSSVKVNMKEVYKRKKKMVDSFREGSQKKLEETDKLDLIFGEASFIDASKIIVTLKDQGTRYLSAEKFFINTGSRAAIPSIDGLEKISYFDSTSIMELTEIPEHLLIIGGGYIGVEFGQMFRRFGSNVTLIQKGEQLLSREDPDIAEEVKIILEEDGIKILLNSNIQKAGRENNKIVLKLNSGKNKTVTGSHLLIAAGHKANTEDLNLPAAGIKTDEKGYIKTNDRLETNIEGIYALGDVKGGPAFTHISYDDYRVVRDNLIKNKNKSVKNRLVPYTVFMDPQLGRVGLNEKEAKEKGIAYLVAKLPMSSVARAIEVSETRGMMKIIIDKKSEKILGCGILGIEGGELMSMIQRAIIANLKYQAIQEAVFTHPTLAESLNNVFSHLE